MVCVEHRRRGGVRCGRGRAVRCGERSGGRCVFEGEDGGGEVRRPDGALDVGRDVGVEEETYRDDPVGGKEGEVVAFEGGGIGGRRCWWRRGKRVGRVVGGTGMHVAAVQRLHSFSVQDSQPLVSLSWSLSRDGGASRSDVDRRVCASVIRDTLVGFSGNKLQLY